MGWGAVNRGAVLGGGGTTVPFVKVKMSMSKF